MTLDIDSTFCTRCGARIGHGGASCPSCGAPSAAAAAPPAPPTTQIPVVRPATYAPPPQAGTPEAHRPAAQPHGLPNPPHGMPSPMSLVPGEQVRYRAEFSPHLILSHLKVHLVATDRRVMVHEPHTLFGVIEHGYLERSSPLPTVCEVTASYRVETRKIIWGIGMVLVGLFLLFTVGGFVVLGALALFAAAAWQFLTCRVLGVFVRNHGAGVLVARAGRAEQFLVEQAAAALNEVLLTSPEPAG